MPEQDEVATQPEDAEVAGHLRRAAEPGESDVHSDESGDEVEGHLRR